MTEDELLKAIIQTAHLFGWRCFHQRAGRTAGGSWARTTEGDSGFPDLVLAHPRRPGVVLFIECKSATGRLRPEQERWRDVLLWPAGPRWFLLRPQHWADGTIERLLRGDGLDPQPPGAV